MNIRTAIHETRYSVIVRLTAAGVPRAYQLAYIGDSVFIRDVDSPSRYGVVAAVGTIVTAGATVSGGVRWQHRTDADDLDTAIRQVVAYLSNETERL